LNHQTKLDDPELIHGTLIAPSYVYEIAIPVNFSLSSQACLPLVPEMPYVIADLSQQLLSEHHEGIPVPSHSDMDICPPPIYIGANITVQFDDLEFVLSLALKLSLRQSGFKRVGETEWMSLMGFLEQSKQQMDREARNRRLNGLGSVVVFEMNVEEVHMLAKWIFWRIVDGKAMLCEKETVSQDLYLYE
jgi:hypothetical protein